MSTIKIATTYTLVCDKCKTTVEVKQNGIPKSGWLNTYNTPELKGWKIEHDHVYNRTVNKHFTEIVDVIVCPACIEKDRQERMKSDNIIERSYAGYYNENPERFVPDVYKEFGISETHPKIKKFWELVSDKDSYSEKLHYIEEIIELFQ